jgi:lipoate-protein ligase A
LQDGLRRLGVPATLALEAANGSVVHGPICFDRPSAHEILLRGRKLVGSAQMRRGGGILQHGSILIEPRIDTLSACLRLTDGPSSQGIKDGVAGLAELGVTRPSEIATAILDAFAASFGVTLVEASLRADEEEAIRALAASKYRSAAWTERLVPARA